MIALNYHLNQLSRKSAYKCGKIEHKDCVYSFSIDGTYSIYPFEINKISYNCEFMFKNVPNS